MAIVPRLHSLLHTMRCIDQHEEQLCSLMHHIQSKGKLDTRLRGELSRLLDDLPTAAYEADLAALRHSLESLPAGSERRPSPAIRKSKKVSKPATPRRRQQRPRENAAAAS